MKIKDLDITEASVWAINHMIRTKNPFQRYDLDAMILYFEKRDDKQYQVKNIINQTNGLIAWQIKEV